MGTKSWSSSTSRPQPSAIPDSRRPNIRIGRAQPIGNQQLEITIRRTELRRELLGDYELNLLGYYGGMPYDEAERSLRLFAAEVLPELRRW